MKLIHQCFISVFVLVFAVGCSGGAFKKAVEADTITSYEKFINNYSDNVTLASKARKRLEELVFVEAKETNSINGYEHYLALYKNGRFSNESRNNIEDLRYQDARLYNTTYSYKKYIGKYPDGKYTNEAKKIVEELIWGKLSLTDSKKSYQKYLKQYENGHFSSTARKLIQILSYNKNIHRQYYHIRRLVSGATKDLNAPQKYLDLYKKLYYTTKDLITINSTKGPCQEIFILGKRCITNIFSGRVMKNDLIFMMNQNKIRTLHTVENLTNINVNYDDEAYGDIGYLKREQNITNKNLFTKYPPNKFAKKYSPTIFVKETSDWSGTLHDIGKWMKNNPAITTALGVAAAYTVLSTDNDNSSNYAQNQGVTNDQCISNAINSRIATCNVIPQFECDAYRGCPEDKIECDKGWSGKTCESDSAGSYYINTFGLSDFYCDIKNNNNKSKDINIVINNICGEN